MKTEMKVNLIFYILQQKSRKVSENASLQIW